MRGACLGHALLICKNNKEDAAQSKPSPTWLLGQFSRPSSRVQYAVKFLVVQFSQTYEWASSLIQGESPMRRLLLLGLSLFRMNAVAQTMTRRRYLPFVLLLLSPFAPAQTTTTYHVSSTVGGRWGYPFRAFSIPFSEGGSISWLQIGSGSSCAGQTIPADGFLFTTVANQGMCIPLKAGSNVGDVTFDSVDDWGNSVHGEFDFTVTVYKCGYGGKGGSGTCFQIASGTLTLTQK